MEKEIGKELGSWVMEVGSFSYLVVCLQERNQRILKAKLLPLWISSSMFLRMLYSWSQVLDGGSKVPLLDFVNKIMHESSRVWWFLYFPLVSHLYNPLITYPPPPKKKSNAGGIKLLIYAMKLSEWVFWKRLRRNMTISLNQFGTMRRRSITGAIHLSRRFMNCLLYTSPSPRD